MEKARPAPSLKTLDKALLKDKIVLVRVDHNVVKKGIIKDPYRIDSTIGTLYSIAEKGGRPVVITHVGRPRDKKSGLITCREEESVRPVIRYLEEKLPIKIHYHELPADGNNGITEFDTSADQALEDLRTGKIGMIYLQNSRWFKGEQSEGAPRRKFIEWLASVSDVFVNDAFGAWRAHASTYDIAARLPSFAGALLEKEISNLYRVLEPERPFLAVIAGSKYDTKIGPLKALYGKVDHLILGGLMHSTFLSAKYGIQVKGVTDEDRKLAMELVELDKRDKKILEMTHIIESDIMEGKKQGTFRTIKTEELAHRDKCNYLLDVDPESFQTRQVKEAIEGAKTIFVNAVMGLMPHFYEGSQAIYRIIGSNRNAMKLFGGGDTLQELKNLCPGIYLEGLDSPQTYFFTGGGSVLAAVENGNPYALKPVQALLE